MQLVEIVLGTVDVNVPAIRGLKHCNVGLYVSPRADLRNINS